MPSTPPGGQPPFGGGAADPDSERLFLHALLDSSPDHIYFKDTQSRFICISRALARNFSLSDPSEALGKTDFDFHPREKAEVRFQDERRIMETLTPMVDKVEQQTNRSDGKPAWVLTSKAPLCDSQGRVVGTFGISRDITRLMAMEAALGRERNLLRTVIDNVPDYIFAKDASGRYTLNNQAHVRFLGKNSPEEIYGKTLFDLLPLDIATKAHADDMAVVASGEPILDRLEAPSPQQWLLTSKIPVFDIHRAVTGLVAISRDITEQKLAQEQLEKANADLCQSRENLLNALAELRSVQIQLVEAEKMKLVGRLAAGVAHEVKNPLAIIGLGLEYLNSQKFDDPNIPVVLAEIGGAVQRADNVVRGLLDFSAPKKMDYAPEDVNRVVRSALLLARGELGPRKIAVVEEFTSDLPLVRLDAMKIEQALVNLFSNAAQAMGGGGRLTVRTSVRQVTGIGENVAASDRFRPGTHVVAIEILDTGPGIPENALGKIFEPFFTTKPTGKGSGLGLTVTKTIIDLHGGEIEIGNRPEGGACVTLLFSADTD